MALAFKRAVGEAEKAIEGANKSINDWYKPPVQPALVIDYDSAKAVEGVSTQNPNKEEKPKAITIVNWVKDNYNYMHSIWGDVKYKGDKQGDLALKLFFKHIEKAILHFDDKSNGKKYNSYDAEIKGKELHITVHFDFANYPQQLNLKDEKNGVNISAFVWAHLNAVEHIDFQLMQESLLTYQYSALKDAAKVVKEKCGKDVPISIDFENIRKIAGTSVYYGNKPPVCNNWLALNFLGDGKGLNSLAYAVAELCKDKLGKEAFAESFDSIVVHVDGGATEKKGTYSFTKEGKALHCHYKLDYNVNAANWGCSSTPMAKQLEGML